MQIPAHFSAQINTLTAFRTTVEAFSQRISTSGRVVWSHETRCADGRCSVRWRSPTAGRVCLRSRTTWMAPAYPNQCFRSAHDIPCEPPEHKLNATFRQPSVASREYTAAFAAASMFDRYGPLLTLAQLALMLDRSTDGIRTALREANPYAERLNAAKGPDRPQDLLPNARRGQPATRHRLTHRHRHLVGAPRLMAQAANTLSDAGLLGQFPGHSLRSNGRLRSS